MIDRIRLTIPCYHPPLKAISTEEPAEVLEEQAICSLNSNSGDTVVQCLILTGTLPALCNLDRQFPMATREDHPRDIIHVTLPTYTIIEL